MSPEARDFLSTLYTGKPDDARICIFTLPNRRSRFFTSIDEAAAFAEEAADRQNVYFGLGLSGRDLPPTERVEASEAAGIPGLWADLDIADPEKKAHKKGNLPPDLAAVRMILERLPLLPTVLVHSGHGLHAYWLFPKPWWFADDGDREHAAALSEAWQRLVAGIAGEIGYVMDATHDLARVLRVPGTLNHKTAPPVRARVLEEHERRFTVDELEAALEAVAVDVTEAPALRPEVQARPVAERAVPLREAQPAQTPTLVVRPDAEPPQDKLSVLCTNDPKFACTWDRKRTDLPSASEYDLALASFAARAGWTDQEIVDLLIAWRRWHGEKEKLRPKYYRDTITKARTSGSRVSADAIVAAVRTSGDVRTVFENVETLARFPPGDYATVRATLKEILGRALNLNALDQAVRGARRVPPVDPTPGERPRIVVGRALRDLEGEALAALRGANDPPVLFVRSGALTRVRGDEHGRPIVEVVREAELTGRLAEVADFVKPIREGFCHVDPPERLVKTILARGEWPFPALQGLTESPVLRPDGTVLDTPGYDRATALIYTPRRGLTMWVVPGAPTADDVHRALDLLDEAIGEFPYVDAASRANATALLITPVVRPAISGKVLLALIDKPKAGTGASLFAQVVAMIATGRPAAMLGAPKDEEEWRKMITSVLLGGAAMVVLDNVDRSLASSSLARALTAPEWEDRALGRNETIRVPQRAVWLATGNNFRLAGDIQRRSYWIRMDAQVARPWQRRTFRHADLIGWVEAHRGELLSAILTLARAWFAAGCPRAEVPTVGGYDEWARLVGGILAHAGLQGFLTNLERLYEEADEEDGQWAAFLACVAGTYGERPFTVAELCEAVRDHQRALWEALPDDLVEAAEASFGSLRARLGRAFAKRADTPYGEDGLRLERAGDDSHRKVARWRVRGTRGTDPTFARTRVPVLRVVGEVGGMDGEGGYPPPQVPHSSHADVAALACAAAQADPGTAMFAAPAASRFGRARDTRSVFLTSVLMRRLVDAG